MRRSRRWRSIYGDIELLRPSSPPLTVSHDVTRLVSGSVDFSRLRSVLSACLQFSLVPSGATFVSASLRFGPASPRGFSPKIFSGLRCRLVNDIFSYIFLFTQTETFFVGLCLCLSDKSLVVQAYVLLEKPIFTLALILSESNLKICFGFVLQSHFHISFVWFWLGITLLLLKVLYILKFCRFWLVIIVTVVVFSSTLCQPIEAMLWSSIFTCLTCLSSFHLRFNLYANISLFFCLL